MTVLEVGAAIERAKREGLAVLVVSARAFDRFLRALQRDPGDLDDWTIDRERRRVSFFVGWHRGGRHAKYLRIESAT
jgi:hypothetical protein